MTQPFIGRLIAYKTYTDLAKKYEIPVKTKNGEKRGFKPLQTAIYKHEKKKFNDDKRINGLYFINKKKPKSKK